MRILLVDCFNQFYRSYIADPSLDKEGLPVGGVKGFLKILQKLISETKPDTVIAIWDGPGGSLTRRGLNSDYKSGRKPIKMNRNYDNLTDNEELINKVRQQVRIVEYLNKMPIIQIMLPSIEADDVIAYFATSNKYKNCEKIIVSSDKDFYQLCDEKTILYRTIKGGQIKNAIDITEETGIHPINHALAKAIVGDVSDNIIGIPRVGYRTLSKKLPFLKENREYMLHEIIDFCKLEPKKLKIHINIISGRKKIQQNYKLVQLKAPNLSYLDKSKIETTILEFECKFSKMEIIKMMIPDDMSDINWNRLWANFNRMCWGE